MLLNRSCGRLLTSKDGVEGWTLSGQCVVVDQRLLLTAAHVCFYHDNQQCRAYHLQAHFALTDGKELKFDVYPVRWSGTMDVAVLYIRDPPDDLRELKVLSGTVAPNFLMDSYFVHYPLHIDDETIKAARKAKSKFQWSCVPHIERSVITGCDKNVMPGSGTESRWYSCYRSNSGDSGAAVLCYAAGHGFQLLGIHLGAGYLPREATLVLNEIAADSVEAREVKRLKPNTVQHSDETSEESGTGEYGENSISVTTNSVASDSEGKEDDNANDANASKADIYHGQTNPSVPYFTASDSIFRRHKWDIASILNNPEDYEFTSPPRLPRPEASSSSSSSSASSGSTHHMITRRGRLSQHNGQLPLRLFPTLSLYDE